MPKTQTDKDSKDYRRATLRLPPDLFESAQAIADKEFESNLSALARRAIREYIERYQQASEN